MQTITLSNGVQMPAIGYGVYKISNGEMPRCLREALECGYRLIDTAQWYDNEEGVGKVVAECHVPRSELFITTKLQSGLRVADRIDESLRRLRVDYVDLLLIHWPMGNDAATWHSMESAYGCGKVRAIGLSNFYGDDLEKVLRQAEVMPHVIQQELHPFRQQNKLVMRYRQMHIVPQAWSPLACGRQNIFSNPVLTRIGKAHHKTAAQVALRFLVQSGICPIPKSVHKERMTENIDIFDFLLSGEELAAIRALDLGHGLFGWYD